MSVYDKVFLAAYFLGIMIAQSYWQKALFDKHITINKRLHAVYYLVAALPIMYFFMPIWWKVLLLAVLERLAFYDLVINIVRRKRPILLYNGKDTTNSEIDQIENELKTGQLLALKWLYIIGFVAFIIFIK